MSIVLEGKNVTKRLDQEETYTKRYKELILQSKKESLSVLWDHLEREKRR